MLEEALYREAMAAGLDRDDTIVRRRMRQKTEFVVNDIIEQAAPSEAELEQWLADHPESFACRHATARASRGSVARAIRILYVRSNRRTRNPGGKQS